MVYVYVIKSLSKNYRYVGITNNLTRRIKQHNKKIYKPFKIILTEEYPDYYEARKREKFLKSGAGRNFLDSLLK